MNDLNIKELIIDKFSHEGDDSIKTVGAENALFVGGSAFKNCTNLTDVYFGYDITRISHGAFENCKSLKDVWFAIIDEDKIVEIAEDAFIDCEQEITFHIFGTAIKNKYLNSYARRHHFRVVGMM